MADTIGAGSFSRLKDYESCPMRAKLKYIDKRPAPEAFQNNEYTLLGHKIHKALEDYIQHKTDSLPPECQLVSATAAELRELFPTGVVEVEQDWGFGPHWEITDWFSETIWLRVKLDVFVRVVEEHGRVIDWKSGKVKEIEHTSQGQLYAIAAFCRYPELAVVDVEFIYTQTGKSRRRTYLRKDIVPLVANWDQRLTKMTAATVHPAKPNKGKCTYCEFGTTKGTGECAWGVA
jgi:CRISPR/Cas system-associated exonuclease Cas4 (RecB family)